MHKDMIRPLHGAIFMPNTCPIRLACVAFNYSGSVIIWVEIKTILALVLQRISAFTCLL